VLEQGSALTPKDIQRECQAKLESFMLPKYVEIVPDLPTTSTGKIKKTDLR
jgi:acyl-CoA synthetase (AMP-forming)/AMP-acid ligase II